MSGCALADYMNAMRAGNIDACARIEQRFDLFGYPPEIVSVGLKAADEGRCQHVAIDEYIGASA